MADLNSKDHKKSRLMHNNRINPDWQFRCASLPAGYAERYAARKDCDAASSFGEEMAIQAFDLNIEEVLENWEVEHALREVIANALDEQVRPMEASVSVRLQRRTIQ